MQKLLNIKVSTYQIDCLTKKTKRAEYINKFKSNVNLSLMLNVQILNEGIDIPICDSVFVTNPNNNIENLVQRMSRSNRIYHTKTECRIYMYCGEKKISKILDYINTNTNNELTDKIYKIRFDNKEKPIETKYIGQFTNNLNLNMFDKIFQFNETEIFIIFDKKNNIWYKLKDILIALNYNDTKDAIKNLKIDEKYMSYLKDIQILKNVSKTLNIQPKTKMINNNGLFMLLLISKKPLAKTFMRIYIDNII